MLDERFIAEYQRHAEALSAQGEGLQRFLAALLERHGIQVHLLSNRLKTEESLRHKLSRPDRMYAKLWDVTDLVGLRITTYFEDAIAQVGRAIEGALPVDFARSTDKLRATDQRAFGYRSLHYVSALPVADPALPQAFRFEIQVRTVLQHAWAEVEHDLGYKVDDPIPEDIRRRFSRVASLLEIADQEFVAMRRDLDRYRRSIEAGLADPSRSLPLDAVSLRTVARSREVRQLDEAIARLLGKPLVDEVFFPEYLLKMLRFARLDTTKRLYGALRGGSEEILGLVRPYFEFTQRTWKRPESSLGRIYSGYGLFFLSHVAILRSAELEISKVSRLAELYQALDYPEDPRAAQEVASGLVAALMAEAWPLARAGCAVGGR